MKIDTLGDSFEKIREDDCKEALKDFLVKYSNPTFGCHPKKEVDLLILEMLQRLKVLKPEPTLYDLVTQLRIQRTRARTYLYELELRGLKNTEELDEKLKKVLLAPIIQKKSSGGAKPADFMFAIEIENPLLIDHLRKALAEKGHAVDSSFSPSLVRITLDAMAGLIEKYAVGDNVAKIEARLKNAGIADPEKIGILRSILFNYAKKYVGDKAIEALEEYVSPYFDAITEVVPEKVRRLFSEK